MYSILLAIIYAAFISLGLPDSLIGSGWPAMYGELGVPLSFAGILTMIIAGGTIVSSLFSEKLIKKLGVGLVTAVSVLLTAGALLGFSLSRSFGLLCLLAVPYGLGAGAIDAALNNYVALHYSSRHMNWLHCCWGIGASISPYIMSHCLTGGLGWSAGYRSVSVIQFALTLLIFLSLPLWKASKGEEEKEQSGQSVGIAASLKIKGVKYMLLTFFSYCALESTAGLWTSSYLISVRGVALETAAQFSSLFFLGITAGRFLSGFVSNRLGDKRIIRTGILTILFGIALLLLPIKADGFALGGLLVIGLGCAPIYPAVIHSTPQNFGKENSQSIIGIQMASAYLGSTFMPPLMGLLAERITIALFPPYLCLFAVLMLVMSERLNRCLNE